MDKSKFEKIKKISVCVILALCLVLQTTEYKKLKEEKTEIKFYGLETEESVSGFDKAFETADTNDTAPGEGTEAEDDVFEEENQYSGPYKDDGPKIVNINDATSKELQELYGIGPELANRIIDYRNQYGPFVHSEEIIEVKGIGDATYQKIKDYITVNEH